MDEYIKKEYAVDAVLDVYYDTPDIDLSGEKFEAAILKIQAADVAPVRHGRWVPTKAPFMNECEDCSVCGYRTVWGHRYNYCPNCGAKMDGERKD